LGHLLKEILGVLEALNMGHCITRYSDILSLDIDPSENLTWHELLALLGTSLVDGYMEKNLASV
jgi:hypothetical protein